MEGPLACHWNAVFDVTHLTTHVVFEYRVAFNQQLSEQVCLMHIVFSIILPCMLMIHEIMQIVWWSYNENVVAALPAYCTAGRDIWSAQVPLICFYIVKWYFPAPIWRSTEYCTGSEHR